VKQKFGGLPDFELAELLAEGRAREPESKANAAIEALARPIRGGIEALARDLGVA